MGGSSIEEDWDIASPVNDVRTILLVGRTGNGKSATGNSILGRRAFKSKASSSGVTSICELQSAMLRDGHQVNVIDTPGLFEFPVGTDFVGKEILKCIDLAKDGIHAVLIVFSARTRFSQEEEATLRSLQTLFGDKIVNYMIIVFTGGDHLEESEETLEDYLGPQCPQPLKDIITLCRHRLVLFDNKTKDETKRAKQVLELLSLINLVMAQNGGRPYMDELFVELQEGAKRLRDQQEEVASLKGNSEQDISNLKEEQIKKSYEDQLRRITDMVESKLKETMARLELQLVEEHAAILKAEEFAQLAQMKSNDETRKLREDLERAQREFDELRKMAGNKCATTHFLQTTCKHLKNSWHKAVQRFFQMVCQFSSIDWKAKKTARISWSGV